MSLQLKFPPLHSNIIRREPWTRRIASYTSSRRPATVRLIDRASSLTPGFDILKRFQLFGDLRARICIPLPRCPVGKTGREQPEFIGSEPVRSPSFSQQPTGLPNFDLTSFPIVWSSTLTA